MESEYYTDNGCDNNIVSDLAVNMLNDDNVHYNSNDNSSDDDDVNTDNNVDNSIVSDSEYKVTNASKNSSKDVSSVNNDKAVDK